MTAAPFLHRLGFVDAIVVQNHHDLDRLGGMLFQDPFQQLPKANIVLVRPRDPDQLPRDRIHSSKDVAFRILTGRIDLRLLAQAHPTPADRREEGHIHLISVVEVDLAVAGLAA